MLKYLIIIFSLVIVGCASQSAKMAHQIEKNPKNNFIATDNVACKKMIAKSEDQDLIFNTRLIATPIIGIIGIFAAPAILAANASFDFKDRFTASEMSKACGGSGIDTTKIVGDVAINGSIGVILQGTNLSIYPGGEQIPVSSAAEAATN